MVKINLLKSRVEEKIDLQRSSADSSRPDEAYVFHGHQLDCQEDDPENISSNRRGPGGRVKTPAPVAWLDRHLWIISIAMALVGAVGCLAVARAKSLPLLSKLVESTRTDLMSSLAETAGSLLGPSLAAMSILIAIPKATKKDVRLARQRIAIALLAQAGLLGLVLVIATYLIVLAPVLWLSALLLGCLTGCVIGLLVVGTAFALAIVEQGEEP